MKRIGFVGLGHMGFPMACNLLKAGYQVTGFDLQPLSLENFVAAGGEQAIALKDAIEGQDAVITMLQTGQQVKQVCLGEEGLLHHAHPKQLLIDCSSIDVNSSRAVHQAARESGLYCVDAPVSGGVAGAQAGTLTFMVGGVEEAFNLAKPVLTAMGKKIIATGPAGSGQAAKMCNNMILGISMAAISEAFVLAEALGLSAEKLHEVVMNSSGQCWSMSNYVPVPGILDNVPANRDYQPGFTTQMMLKDLKLSQATAKELQIKTPIAEQATALYQSWDDKHKGQLDFSSIIQLIAQMKE